MNSKNEVNFIASCPRGHRETLHWQEEELRTALRCGTLWLHCMKCREDWLPSQAERDGLERLLAERG